MPDTTTEPAPSTQAPATAPAPDKTPPTPPVSTDPTRVPTLEQKPETIDPFDELDRRWKEKTGKSIGEEEPAKTEVEEAPKEPDAETPKPEEKPATEPKAEKKIAEPKALRQQLEKTSTELKTAREQHAALQKRLEEAEARSKDTTVVSEQLAAKDKEIESLRADLRSAKQEMDPEFKAKYDQPFTEAAEYAKQQIEQLFVLDPETGEPSRNANWEDFAALYNLPMGKAISEAKKMFGDATGMVIEQISGLRRMDATRQKALAMEKVKWADRAKQEEAQRVQQREAFEAASIKVDKDIKDKHPEWFGEDPNDPEGTKLLKDGYALVDSKPRSFQEAVILRSQIRARAAAFGRIAMENAALKKQIDEMKGKVQSMKDTEPGPVKRSSGSEPTKPKDWKDELRTTLAS